MKNKMCLFLLCLAFAAFAQNGTTLEEYRYLTKGYAYQKEMGLDASKQGYSFQLLYEHSNGIRFIGMFGRQHTPRAVLTVLPNGSSQPTYICLPNNGSEAEILKMYETAIQQKLVTTRQKLDFQEAQRAFMMHLLANSSAQPLADSGSPASYSQELILTNKGIPISTSDPNEAYPRPEPIHEVTTSAYRPPSAKSSPSNINKQVSTRIGGDLMSRSLIKNPVVMGSYKAKGKVVIKLCVDERGEIETAKFTQRGSTTFNSELKELALAAVRATRFANSSLAEQCGTIAFHFK